MNDFMQQFGEFWKNWGPWISISLIPTIITGLSLSPKTKGAAGFVEKAWGTFKQLLSLLSLATHRDDPGTFQLPLKMGKVVKRKKKDGAPPSAGPGCAAGLLLVFTLASVPTQMSCSWLRSDTANNIKDAAIDCSIEAVKGNAAHLLPVIMAILTGKAPNWQQQLEAFTKELGRDAVACALQMASIELQAKVAAGPSGEPTPETATAMDGVTRARTYVDGKGWKYAPGEQ